jgi:GntR family transcriptional repressor for pyruvate dehydrogenase complex
MQLEPPKPRENLTDAVVASLQTWLRGGGLAPGSRLPSEHDLAGRLGVSRPVLREALAQLKASGLVESRRGSGLYTSHDPHPNTLRISRWEAGSLDNVQQIFELRGHLEAGAAELAAVRRTEADLADLENAMALQRAATRDGVAEDLAFHFAVARAARNDYFLRVLELLSGFLAAAMKPAPEPEGGFLARKQAVETEHRPIVEAIRAGDPQAAHAAMRAHLDGAWRRISRQAAGQGGGETGVQDAAPPGEGG